MPVNQPIAGQSLAGIASIEHKMGLIRSTGTMGVDVRLNYTDPDAHNFVALSAEDIDIIEDAAALIHAIAGGYESGDASKVKTELVKDREALTIEPLEI